MRSLEDTFTLLNGIVPLLALVCLRVKYGAPSEALLQDQRRLLCLWNLFWGSLVIAYVPFYFIPIEAVSTEAARVWSLLGMGWVLLLVLISEVSVRSTRPLVHVSVMRWVARYSAAGGAFFFLSLLSDHAASLINACAFVICAMAYQLAARKFVNVVTCILWVYALLIVVFPIMPPRPDGTALFLAAGLLVKIVLLHVCDRTLASVDDLSLAGILSH
jgi:hypothetical protein